jgi:hypothetical protein
MFAKPILLVALAGFAIFYLVVFLQGLARARRAGGALPSLAHLATGFGTNFLDTLGIGSFATSTSISMPKFTAFEIHEHGSGRADSGNSQRGTHTARHLASLHLYLGD